MHRRAFTLIELLVVISIISLLSSVVLASLSSARTKARGGSAKQFYAQTDRIIGDSAVGWWDFDECSGSSTADLSGFGAAGTFVGSPSWSTTTAFNIGCSLSLNGTQYVNAGYTTSYNITGDITIALWIKRSTFAGHQGLVAKTVGSGWDYDFYFNNSEPTKLEFYSGQTTPNSRRSTATVEDTDWHHVAVTRSGSNVTFYIDGQFAGSGTMTGAFGTSASGMVIGSEVPGSNRFNGLLDEVRIYSRAVTAAEMGKIYAQGAERLRLAGQL